MHSILYPSPEALGIFGSFTFVQDDKGKTRYQETYNFCFKILLGLLMCYFFIFRKYQLNIDISSIKMYLFLM